MRRELFNIPARITRTNRAPTLQPPPDPGLLTVVLTKLQTCPPPARDNQPPPPTNSTHGLGTPTTRRDSRATRTRTTRQHDK
jgi:hypothetical protein